MRKFSVLLMMVLGLSACNSVYVKSNSLDTTQVFYVDRGGYTMRRSIKEAMEGRGYNVVVGSATSNENATDDENSVDIDKYLVPSDAKYIVKVKERKEYVRPFWCALNGFWWWNFNVSIADQTTGRELMTWRGRGCANSSVRKLNKILDKMEQ